VKAAGAELDRRAKISSDEALEWLEAQLDERPYLEPLRKRVPVLEVTALVEAMEAGKVRGGFRIEKVRDVVQKYPEDADVAWIAAILVGKTRVPEASLPFFYDAMKRGHAPGPELWDDCRETLETNVPGDRVCEWAIELCRPHFANELDAWAQTNIKTGGSYSWLNAILIRSQAGDPEVMNDPVLQALLRYSQNKQRPGDDQVILADTNAARGERIRDTLQEISTTYSVSSETKQSMKALVPELEKRWPEPVASPTP
jgi:hypothetical protein